MDMTRCHLCGAPDYATVAVCKRCGAERRDASAPAPDEGRAFEGGRVFEGGRAFEGGFAAEELGREGDGARPRPRPRPAPRATAAKGCPTCFAPCAASAHACPRCGHKFPGGVRARYVVVPVAMALVLALFAAVRYFDEKAKEARLRNLQARAGVALNFVDPATGEVEAVERPTPQRPWFSSWFRSRPTAEEVFGRYVEVSGGAEALRRVRSHHSEGTLSFNAADSPNAHYYGGDRRLPPPAKLVSYGKAPDKFATEMEMGVSPTSASGPAVSVRRGFDGRRGWERVESYEYEAGAGRWVKRAELREFEGAELEQVRRYAGAGLVRTAGQYASLVMLDNRGVVPARHYGRKEFERECYVVRALNPENRLETFYFDVDDGRLLRFDFDAQGPEGPTTVECYPDDYRKVEDVLVPFRMSFKADGLWATVAFTEFRLNAPVLDSAFETPAS